MRIFVYGSQSSGASLFSLWLCQREGVAGVLDLFVRERVPARELLPHRELVLKATVSDVSLTEQLERFGPDRSVLFLRDPCQTWLSLDPRPYRDTGGSLEDKLAKLDGILRERRADFDAVVRLEDFVEAKGATVEGLRRRGFPVGLGQYLFWRPLAEVVAHTRRSAAYLDRTYGQTWAVGNIEDVRAAPLRVRRRTVPPGLADRVARLCPTLTAMYEGRPSGPVPS